VFKDKTPELFAFKMKEPYFSFEMFKEPLLLGSRM
jgi:hypothetical protein